LTSIGLKPMSAGNSFTHGLKPVAIHKKLI